MQNYYSRHEEELMFYAFFLRSFPQTPSLPCLHVSAYNLAPVALMLME